VYGVTKNRWLNGESECGKGESEWNGGMCVERERVSVVNWWKGGWWLSTVACVFFFFLEVTIWKWKSQGNLVVVLRLEGVRFLFFSGNHKLEGEIPIWKGASQGNLLVVGLGGVHFSFFSGSYKGITIIQLKFRKITLKFRKITLKFRKITLKFGKITLK
jgi:hypothetical protein